MELKKLKLTEIKPYGKNPRKNDGAVDAVAESIKQCGYCSPIVVDENYEVLAGHTRLKALKKLGRKECEVVVKEGLTEEQKQKYRILDNKTGEFAEWDLDILQEQLKDLDFEGFDFGFDFPSFEEPLQIVEDEIPEVDNENEPITQLGDIWQLGEHRLMCGDSTDAGTVAILMDGKQADLFLTDPPYNVAYVGKTKDALTIKNDKMKSDKFREFLTSAFTAAVSVLKEGGGFYIWFASREHCNFETALNDSGLEVRQELIWKKNSLVIGRQDYQWKHEPCLYGWKDGAAHYFTNDRCQTTVFEDDTALKKMTKEQLIEVIKELQDTINPSTIIHEAKPQRNELHPTMKPINLIGRLVRNSSKPKENVFDGFGGSGSTLIACEQLGRKCYTMELDPKYVDVIIKRWEELTGKKAVKIN